MGQNITWLVPSIKEHEHQQEDDLGPKSLSNPSTKTQVESGSVLGLDCILIHGVIGSVEGLGIRLCPRTWIGYLTPRPTRRLGRASGS